MGEPVKSGRNCFLIFNLASICESLTSGPSHATDITREGAHGFMRTHKWRDSIGAFINVEASGTGGPGSWPSSVYAQSAIYPMAHSVAQGRELIIAEKINYLVFMINAFQDSHSRSKKHLSNSLGSSSQNSESSDTQELDLELRLSL
ncbi:uncharacterized protein LOC105791187 isoform X2 [Gossypium raimondii]|uniref:uncharacterized protein LOC105791187 isoform X2 n=1 Tax=Gossypium raimondii TaxID=29730 RepID=UPI00227BC9E8|nr:uncharacterized protein LOC105791187 isoform X2 [Gossypium raimondii]